MTTVDEVRRLAERQPPSFVSAAAFPEPMDEKAFYGLAGDVVRTIEPHSEADRVALLVEFLLHFGNVIGRGPGMQIEGDFHATNEYAVIFGDTSKGRKGTGHGRINQLFRQVDPTWVAEREIGGLVSGEGLIWEVRDQIVKRRKPTNKAERELVDEDGLITDVVDPGVSDKRLFVIEPEFAQVLAITKREGNTLSMAIRELWDRPQVRTAAKNSPAKATGPHVSIVAHITADELRRELTDTSKGNGFANRFMFFAVRRSKSLPYGGHVTDFDLFFLVDRLRKVIDRVCSYEGRIRWGEDAKPLWERVYGELSEGKPGMLGAVTGRAEAHTVRLAGLFALLDAEFTIRRPHLEAALAVWDYAERSSAYVFGGKTGDDIADTLLAAIRAADSDGISRSDLRLQKVSHKVPTARFDAALAYLERSFLAAPETVSTGGRPSERWYANNAREGKKPDMGDESQFDPPNPPFHPPGTTASSTGPFAAATAPHPPPTT